MRDEKSKSEKETEKAEKAANGKKSNKSHKASNWKLTSGTLYTAMSHSAQSVTRGDADTFYIDSGASYHLIPSRDHLCSYWRFTKPV